MKNVSDGTLTQHIGNWKRNRQQFRAPKLKFKNYFRKKYRQKYLSISILCFLLLLSAFIIFFHEDKEILERRKLSECGELEEIEIEEPDTLFPKEIFSKAELRSGAIGLHIFAMCLMFMGLAIICDDYFEPTLEACVSSLQLTEDVAGATFMAAGGSAPELATSIIGVFFASSDIGFGTIVGSAVFNVLFVIAICAYIAPGLELSWWPLVRDCSYYCASILILVLCVMNQEVHWWEALTLFICYLIYVLIMKYNEEAYQFVEKKLNGGVPETPSRLFFKKLSKTWIFKVIVGSSIILNLIAIIRTLQLDADYKGVWYSVNLSCSFIFICEYLCKSYAYGFLSYWKDPWNAIDGGLVLFIGVEFLIGSSSNTSAFSTIRLFRFVRVARSVRIIRALELIHTPKVNQHTQTREKDFPEPWKGWSIKEFLPDPQNTCEIKDRKSSHKKSKIEIIRLNHRQTGPSYSAVLPNLEEDDSYEQSDCIPERQRGKSGARAPHHIEDESEEEDDEEDDGPAGLFDIPDNIMGKIQWALTFLLRFFFKFTIIDTTKPENEKYWVYSFSACVIWIAILSYVMVWMATVLGSTFNIPDPVMGLTLLAGGTSIPDLLSSAAVARQGYGDMAVSSSIGSNIFDILVGLPVPWLLYTTVFYPGETIKIQSDGLTIMVLSLFLMVAFVCLLIHYYGWVLSKKLAYSFVTLYVVFIVESLLLEYGSLFGSSCT